MEIKNKTILILSQQDWGGMFISKHHYSLELAKRGNTVFFINGPDQRNLLKPGEVRIEKTEYENILLVKHRLSFPYIVRFKAVWLYYKLVKGHIKKIERKINRKIDIVWSFDLSNTIPLKDFDKNALKIYMPVDESGHMNAINAAEGADIIFSVTDEIINKYSGYNVPKYFINHGVSDVFVGNVNGKDYHNRIGSKNRVAFSGNLLRPDIDFKTLLEIVRENENVQFDFYGGYDNKTSNLASQADTEAVQYIEQLKQLSNVVLHGQVNTNELAVGLKNADGFLICYDIVKDQSKGTNYHKIMEYLGTGKVVVSNHVTTYEKYPGLIEMVARTGDNKELPKLFNKVINNLAEYNSEERQQARIAFASEHTYAQQVTRIEKYLQNLNKVVAA